MTEERSNPSDTPVERDAAGTGPGPDDDGGHGGHGAGAPPPSAPIDRRAFLRAGAVTAGVAVATAGALSPLRYIDDFPTLDEFLQRHYKQLTPADKEAIFARIRKRVHDQYDVDAKVGDPPPLPNVEFAYALSLGRCIGCRKCVHACVKENNQSRNPEIQYIRVLRLKKGSIDLESSDHHYDGQVPHPDYYYMPVSCHQCRNPPCTKVCPVKATWQEPDGIVVVDYDWCIGCRYCEAACPYWARRFNFAKPSIPKEDVNPDMAYLSNRPRRKGVVEKCTFCLQRTRNGRYPACVEVCPTGARKFGNLLDPDSEVSYILRTKRVYILKEELGTLPRFYYYFDV